MDLTELLAQFVRESGRYDLVDSLGNDNGALYYLNRGQRLLDRRSEVANTEARNYQLIDAGTYVVHIPHCRVLKEVWLLIGEDQRVPLVRSEWERLQIYYKKPLTQQERSVPALWAPGYLRAVPSSHTTLAETMEMFAGYVDTIADNRYDNDSFFIYPVADQDYGIQVVGDFYTPPLSADIVRTWWTVQHPELVIAAGRYWLEVANRNTEGTRDWLAIIDSNLRDITNDFIENEVVGEVFMGDGYR